MSNSKSEKATFSNKMTIFMKISMRLKGSKILGKFLPCSSERLSKRGFSDAIFDTLQKPGDKM